MKLFTVFLVAAVWVPTATANQIKVTGVVASYSTERDALNVELWLSRPMDMETDRISFSGHDPGTYGFRGGIAFGIFNGTLSNPSDFFTLQTKRGNWHRLGTIWTETQTTAPVPYTTMYEQREGTVRDILAFSIPAEMLRLHEMDFSPQDDYVFRYASVACFNTDCTSQMSGYSTVDAAANTATPEPHSLAMALVAAAALYGYPRLRQRLGQRCARYKPNGVHQ